MMWAVGMLCYGVIWFFNTKFFPGLSSWSVCITGVYITRCLASSAVLWVKLCILIYKCINWFINYILHLIFFKQTRQPAPCGHLGNEEVVPWPGLGCSISQGLVVPHSCPPISSLDLLPLKAETFRYILSPRGIKWIVGTILSNLKDTLRINVCLP